MFCRWVYYLSFPVYSSCLMCLVSLPLCNCRRTWCMSCCGHQQSKLCLLFFWLFNKKMPLPSSVAALGPSFLWRYVDHPWFEFGHIKICTHVINTCSAPLTSVPVWARDFNSPEELITEFCRECRVVRKGMPYFMPTLSSLQMSLSLYLDQTSYSNHSIDFLWLPDNIVPILCATFH